MDYKFIYGGNWDFKGELKGIKAFALDEKGQAKEIGIFGERTAQSIMTILGSKLISVSELNAGGYINSYAIEDDGTLTSLSELYTDSAKLSYVVADPKGSFVYVSSMGDGSVRMVEVADDGSMEVVSSYRLTGHSVTKRQSVAKVHSVMISPDSRWLAAANLGADEIDIFAVDRDKRTITLHSTAAVDFMQEPRHMAFTPDGRFLYVLTEGGSRIYVYAMEEGNATMLAAYNTLDVNDRRGSAAADIVISSDGRYLYSTNRGQNSIVLWNISRDTGYLEKAAVYTNVSEGPRGLTLSPGGSELLSANYEGNSITRISRNPATGELGNVIETLDKPAAGCVRTYAYCE